MLTFLREILSSCHDVIALTVETSLWFVMFPFTPSSVICEHLFEKFGQISCMYEVSGGCFYTWSAWSDDDHDDDDDDDYYYYYFVIIINVIIIIIMHEMENYDVKPGSTMHLSPTKPLAATADGFSCLKTGELPSGETHH